jgi:hypothetical protein
MDPQQIAFLSGPGGSGKNHVIHTCEAYISLCEQLNICYDSRTIVVTALTGAVPVSIWGEITHNTCSLACEVTNEDSDAWKHAYLLIVDVVSFVSTKILETLHQKLGQRKHTGIPIVFAVDFTKSEPVGALPLLYLFTAFARWYDWVHTFIKLETNQFKPPGIMLINFDRVVIDDYYI